ncbi:hypothetical protein JCM8097_007245 [Rhodosporidiobolus ruineniae]
MGIVSDLFGGGTPASSTPANTVHSAQRDKDADEVVRRLTEELVGVRQRNAELEESYRAAVGARNGAVQRIRELEDVIRVRGDIEDTYERKIANLERQNAALLLKEQELFALRLDQAEHPLSSSDAEYRLDQLSDVFDQLKDNLSCPVCYEPLTKNEVVSMSCGHTFCAPCYKSWEERHVEAFKIGPQSGVYRGPECPECRVPDPRRGKVRIWALEEIIRLVDRANRELVHKPFTPPIPPAQPALPKANEAEDGGRLTPESLDNRVENAAPTPVENPWKEETSRAPGQAAFEEAMQVDAPASELFSQPAPPLPAAILAPDPFTPSTPPLLPALPAVFAPQPLSPPTEAPAAHPLAPPAALEAGASLEPDRLAASRSSARARAVAENEDAGEEDAEAEQARVLLRERERRVY